MSTFLIGALAIAFSAIYLASLAARRRTGQLENAIRLRDEFFRAARNLVQDDDTPPVVLDHLEWMAQCIDKPAFGRWLLRRAISGRFRDVVENPPASARELRACIKSMRPEMQQQAFRAVVSFFLAVSFTNFVLGPILRRLPLAGIKRSEEPSELWVSAFMPRDGSSHAGGAPAC